MSEDDRKNVKVSEETHKRLLRVQGYLQSKTGQPTSMNEAVSAACEAFVTLNDNDIPQMDWE